MENVYNGNLHLDIEEADDFTQQLLQLKKILANSTLNINEMVGKTANVDNLLVDDIAVFNDSSKPYQETIEILYNEDGRISLAHERLPGIPLRIADNFAHGTHTLDLSHNNLKDLAFLGNFKMLHTLILDNNVSINENTLPNLPSLRILWLNKCGIRQLTKWIHRINICTPAIRHLSLMGNPGVRSSFNGGSSLENNDYILYVIGTLPKLEYLDDTKITNAQRAMAKTNANAIKYTQ